MPVCRCSALTSDPSRTPTSLIVPGIDVIYNRSSTLETDPAAVLGPSKLDGDFLTI